MILSETISDSMLQKLVEHFDSKDRSFLGMGKGSPIQDLANNLMFCLRPVPEITLSHRKAVLLVPKDYSIYCLESNHNFLTLFTSDLDSDMMPTRYYPHSAAVKSIPLPNAPNEEGLIDGANIISVSTPASSLE